MYIYILKVIKFSYTYYRESNCDVVPNILGCNIVVCESELQSKFFVHFLAGEKARRQLHKNAASNLEQVLAATPHKTPTVQPPASYHENYSS